MGRKRNTSLDAIGRSDPSAGKPDQPASNGSGGIESLPNGGDGNTPGPSAASGTALDLAAIGPGSDGGGGEPERARRKYTRRAGSTKAETADLDLTEFIAENLFAAHAFLAGLSGKDILAIDKSEADDVGKAIQGVAKHYDIPGVNAKTVDWIRLARTLGMVYGTRLFAARAMRGPKIIVDGVVKVPANGAEKPAHRSAPDGMVWASPGPGLPDVLMARQ